MSHLRNNEYKRDYFFPSWEWIYDIRYTDMLLYNRLPVLTICRLKRWTHKRSATVRTDSNLRIRLFLELDLESLSPFLFPEFSKAASVAGEIIQSSILALPLELSAESKNARKEYSALLEEKRAENVSARINRNTIIFL